MTHTLTSRPLLTLRAALSLDVVVTGVNGLAYLVLAGPLSGVLGHSEALLRGVGAFLLVFAAMVAVVSSRPHRGAVLAIVAANAAWAAGSVVAVVAAWGSPETAGAVWTVMQAVVVAGFAELQLIALRSER